MANICDNDFTYYGDNQRELLKFYLIFQQAYEEGNGDAKTILSLLGATPEMIDGIDGRTSVNFVELLMSSETITGVRFMAESAWAPCEDFAKFALLAAIPGGGDIELCYVAEEPGCEVFINTLAAQYLRLLGHKISSNGSVSNTFILELPSPSIISVP